MLNPKSFSNLNHLLKARQCSDTIGLYNDWLTLENGIPTIEERNYVLKKIDEFKRRKENGK